MALGVTEANAVSHEYFDGKKVSMNQVYEDDPFLNKMLRDRQIKTRGGTSIVFPIRYRKYSNANAVGSDQQVAFQTKPTRTSGTDEWKFYSADTMITWKERQQNKGKAQIIDLVADKEAEIRQDMMDRLATDLYTANPNGLGMTSLATIVDSAADYAGVAVADAAAWAGTEDSSTTELVLYGTNSLSYWYNAATFGKFMPNIFNTTRNIASKFESLIEPQQRYQDKETADAGFKNVTFHGVPVLGNPYVPANVIYGLCTKVFELRIDPEWNLDTSPWTDLFAAGFPRHIGKVMSLVMNLLCKMRKCNFKCTAIDPAL